MAYNPKPILTKQQVKELKPGQPLTLCFESTRQLDSAVQTAYSARRELVAENPQARLKITRSGVRNTLYIAREA